MATVLGELFVSISANTGKLDAALVASRGKVQGLAGIFGRLRSPIIPPPSLVAWTAGIRQAAGAYNGILGPAFVRTAAVMRGSLGRLGGGLFNTLALPAVAAASLIGGSFSTTFGVIGGKLGSLGKGLTGALVSPVVAGARIIGGSFATTFAVMGRSLAPLGRTLADALALPAVAAVSVVGREFRAIGPILSAVFGPPARAAGAALRGAFAGAFSGLGGSLRGVLGGVGGIFTSVLGGAASGAARVMSGAFGLAFRGIRATIGGIASGVGAIGSTFTSVLGKLKFPALAGAAAGLGAIGFAVKSAADLESVFSQLRKTTGLTGEPLEKLQNELKTMGVTMSGVSFNDLAGIASMGGRMGIAGEQLSQFTRDIAFVSIALDDIPAEESATKIARILNVFGLSSESALGFASALNKLDDSSTATGRDILEVASRIAPTAATLGLAPAKVLAIAAALKDAGAENEVAGSAISQIFGLMAKDIDAFAQVAGVSTAKFTEALRGDPLVALQLLIGNIQKMDKIDAFSQISTLGIDGVRATSTLLQLSKVMDKLGGFVTVATEEEQSHASILAEVAIQGGTTYAILKRLGNVVQIMAAEIGTFALPLVKALAGSFAELGAGVRDFIAGKAEGIAGFMAPLVQGARNVGLLFSEWPTFLSLAGTTAQGLFLQVTTVLGRLGSGAWEGLTAAGSVAVQFLSNAFSAFAAFLGDLFTQVADNIAGKLQNILHPFSTPIEVAPIIPDLDLLSADKFTKGLPKLPSLGGLFGGAFKGLGLDTLDPALAGRKAEAEDQLAQARARKDAANTVALAKVMGEADRRPFFEVPGSGSVRDARLGEIDRQMAALDTARNARVFEHPEEVRDREEGNDRGELFRIVREFDRLQAERNALLSGGPNALLAPGLDPATRAALGLDGSIPGLADAFRRARLSPAGRRAASAEAARARAAKLAAKKKKAADLAALSPAERRRKLAEAARQARIAAAKNQRGAVKGSPVVDAVEVSTKILDAMLKVNLSMDAQLKKGLIARTI